ncbi:hypothetical protein [Pseudomonas sp. S5D5]|uniref:hypothetical protein n=2 Tax=Pseudomonas sp. S5D5 TaxID=2083056 RepID=UPI000D10F1AF|nr:hypothetical protein [Pseudomonas sp. S5D5]
MPALNLPSAFSASAVARRIEGRYGLAGFARLIKLLEILASSDTASGGIVPLPRSDWRDALGVSDDELYDFLGALMRSGWLSFSEGDEPGAPLVVVFSQADDYLPQAEPLLFTSPEQWVFWCETELNMRREVTGDPLTLGLFRRWCASNVTVTEMHQACEEAAPHHSELTPGVLHAQLQAVRRARLDKARA